MPLIFYSTFILLLLYTVLLLYYRAGWASIPRFDPKDITVTPSTFITVIIPARNEAKNIGSCIDALLKQSYPNQFIEIIVVDDHSTDDTAAVVASFGAAHIKLVSLKDHINAQTQNSFKKMALTIGIAQAKGELIVTTDADCTAPVHWLQTIAACYETYQPSLIVMPVNISPHKNFIELFQALDFMSLQGITGASVNKKLHSMCNGANLAYTKSAFTEVDGFRGIDAIASGDDMLLMHKIALQHPDGIYFLHSQNVIVQTQPVHTVKEFMRQRIRWASKARKYDDKRIFAVLLLVYLLNVLLLAVPFLAVITKSAIHVHFYPFTINASMLEWWWLMLGIKTMVELWFLLPVARFFNEQKTLLWFPVMQPFHILYTVIAGWLGQFGTYRWKDRTVK